MMTATHSPVELEIDLDQVGKHHGFARVPHSVHRSAYGWIPLPVVSVKNGTGPVVVLMGGNHGDEYEGQVALSRLAREISPDQVSGQLIILPMANFPAARAGSRTSPLDQGNLNRLFPGNPNGSPTEIIADFIENRILARADYLLDIHSGGTSMYYQPTALMTEQEDPKLRPKGIALLTALGLVRAVLFPGDRKAGYSSSAASRQGVISITAEIGGGGTIGIDTLASLEHAIRGYLGHLGVVAAADDSHRITGAVEFLRLPGPDYYVFARHNGLFQPAAEIGDTVESGQTAGWIHHPDTPMLEPDEVVFGVDGKIICRRVPAQVERGDCLFEIAVPYQPDP